MGDKSEAKYRNMANCPACGDEKTPGLVVCWHCFKYRDNPFKYSRSNIETWLEDIKRGGEQ